MASLRQCRAAVDQLAATLHGVEPDLRAKHVPRRTVCCHLKDLDVSFHGRLDEDGLHDLRQIRANGGAAPDADVQLTMTSDVLVALAAGDDDFLGAWLRGRIQVSASVRDLLRLRSLLGG
ncbi:MAG TPA: hypothetical protein VG708_04490 [Mycobacteriales bacterium]|nr:hypothetical protein [Mycobacteriales bacterium]